MGIFKVQIFLVCSVFFLRFIGNLFGDFSCSFVLFMGWFLLGFPKASPFVRDAIEESLERMETGGGFCLAKLAFSIIV